VAGCRTPPASERDPTAESVPLAAGDPRPERLVGALERTALARESMRGAARLAIDAPDLRFRRPQRFAAQRPAAIRVEILGLFEQVAAVLVTRDGNYQFFDSSERRLRHGPVTPDLLWEIARVDVTPEQAVELLLGVPTPAADLRPAGARRFGDGSIRVDFADAHGRPRQRFSFDAGERLRRIENLDAAGEPLWEAGFGDYRDLGGLAIAFEIALHFPRQDTHAKLSFRDLELNPELPPGVFVLHVPGGGSSKKPGRRGPGRV